MAYNYPYGMPYQPYMPQSNQQQPNYNNIYQQVQQQPQLNQYAFVNGVEGAKAYQIMPNQTMMLMDSDNPIAFMKTSDNYGKSSLRYFKLVEVKEEDLRVQPQTQSNIEYALKTDIDALNKKIDEISSKLEKPLKIENKGELDNG